VLGWYIAVSLLYYTKGIHDLYFLLYFYFQSDLMKEGGLSEAYEICQGNKNTCKVLI
jgi:hypothetical protein